MCPAASPTRAVRQSDQRFHQGEDMRILRLVTASAALAAALCAAGGASAQDKVTFRLNWIMYGFHTPFYLGLERGYYREEGIALEIGEGQGSVRSAQTVGA